MAAPTPYPELNHILNDLSGGIQTALGTNFLGFYLQGSFALGDFDDNSDCDFIVVTAHDLTVQAVDRLQMVHAAIFDRQFHWAKHLEGSYFPQALLRDYTTSGGSLWYLDHGSRVLIEDPHCNTVVVRWVLREHGVALAGPPPAALIDPIPVKALRQHIWRVMHHWNEALLGDPAPYNNRFYQAYILHAFSRMLHDLIRGCPGSKKAGVAWVKANLDPAWYALLDRSWAGRYDPAVAVRTPADPADFAATLAFVDYILRYAEGLALEL